MTDVKEVQKKSKRSPKEVQKLCKSRVKEERSPNLIRHNQREFNQMDPIRIFISSVQKELTEERMALRDYLHGDPLLRRFFEVFLFEDMPAADQRADQCYLSEVEKCDIYLGVFGNEYGWEDENDGLSPTHREYNLATKLKKQRLIYVKGADDRPGIPR